MGPILSGTLQGRAGRRLDRRSGLRRLLLEPLEPRQLLAAGVLQPPQNVVLLIGDGMGPQHVDAARMFLGGDIVFDDFPHQGEATTFAANTAITDSAAAATAMATGRKVNKGVISTALPGDQSELTTSLEVLRDLGKATGLVTTATITHATPAAFGAHNKSRTDTVDIAADLLGQTRPNVLLGGRGGLSRQAAQAAGYTVVEDRAGLLALDTGSQTFVSGQFGASHLPYEYDGLGDLPHLSEMTAVALDLLDDDPDGFFLMVEGGRIDHAAHVNDIQRNVRETVELANTVEVVLDWAAGRADTLVLVTADHETGGMTVTADNGPGVAPDVTWSTTGHTGVNVPLLAWGAKAEYVTGVMDNSDVFSLTAEGVVQPLGTVDFRSLADLDPSAGDLWYRAEAKRAGLFTIEAVSAAATDGLSVTLYDRDFNQLAVSAPVDGRPRIDWQTDAAVTYYIQLSGGHGGPDPHGVELHLANLVELGPDEFRVTVYGTDGDDRFEAFARSPLAVVINGVRYKLDSAGNVLFSGAAGSDSATVVGSAGIETAALYPGSGTVTGPGYHVQLTEVETIAVEGGGGDDTVWLFGSPGRDKFVGAPRFGMLQGDAFSNRATAFPNVRAEVSGKGISGEGVDTAKLYDSPGDDTLVAAPQSVRLSGEGFSVQIEHFDGVHAYATSGGEDRAEFSDSPGDDLFVGTPTHAALFGDGYYNRAKFFDQALAIAGDGVDVTKFFDSPGDDIFVGKASYAALYNKTYQEQYTDGFYHRVQSFDGVHAYATAGGRDQAKLYDSPGDDIFSANPTQGALFLPGQYYNRAKHFEAVHAFATDGGRDEARLVDSAADDVFYANPQQGALFRPGHYYNRAKFFERVYARARSGGYDEAYLYDSESVDLLEAQDNVVRLSNAVLDFFYEVQDFSYVKATATTEGDTLIADASLGFELDAVGTWDEP